MPRASQNKHARIVLVDDHPLVRERLAEMLNREPDLRVCGEAEDRQQALSVIAASKPDLAIVDLTLKDSHGPDLIKDIQARWPALAVLVVSMHEESLHAERAIRASRPRPRPGSGSRWSVWKSLKTPIPTSFPAG